MRRNTPAAGWGGPKAEPPCPTSNDLRSIKHHLVLHRIDPEQGVRRFYSLMIERDLFGTNGQELVEVHADEIAAGEALEAVARARRRRGNGDL